MIKSVCILGMGYIGLPLAAMLSENGIKVTGVDISQKIVDALNNGEILIEEDGLGELIAKGVANGSITASTVPVNADAFIIAVPTPIKPDKSAEMKYVESATRSVVPYLKQGSAVILESTSPPRTVMDLMLPILDQSGLTAGEGYYIAHSPERVIPGNILHEIIHDSRIIGGINKKSAEVVAELYRTFVKGEIFQTDATTAEMCKLMENTFRDVNIALANEMSRIAYDVGVNIWEAMSLANHHPRVNYLSPGPGVGGHCIALDPWFIAEKSPKNARIVELSRRTNEEQPAFVTEMLLEMLADGNKVTMLGLTFKQDTDDTRESTQIKIADALAAKGIEVAAVDPHVRSNKYLVKDIFEAVKGSSLLIVGVHHTAFKGIDLAKIKSLMKAPKIFDLRNFIAREEAENLGFEYRLLGDAKNRV